MTRRSTTLFAVLVWALSVLLVAVTVLLIAGSRDAQVPAGFDTAGVVETVRFPAATTVGAILAARRPRNPIGWLVLALGISLVVYPLRRCTPRRGCSSPQGGCRGSVRSPGSATGSGCPPTPVLR
jgi:hypothetical protein